MRAAEEDAAGVSDSGTRLPPCLRPCPARYDAGDNSRPLDGGALAQKEDLRDREARCATAREVTAYLPADPRGLARHAESLADFQLENP
jgi:hypothetical protein